MVSTTGALVSVKRVLVVDDNELHRRLLVNILSSLNYQIDEAADGHEAIIKSCDTQPDVVFMDLRMPKVSGEEAMLEIRRKNGAHNACKIIALTADITPDNSQDLTAKGFDDIVSKPYTADQIMRVLESITH